MPAAAEIQADPTWGSQRWASLRLGRSVTVIQRLALVGQIRTKVEPGAAPRYNRADVERLVQQQQGQAPRIGA